MFRILKEFYVGKPQVVAGLMLLAFMAQCLWAARTRRITELEYQYMFSGLSGQTAKNTGPRSPFTELVAALPLKATRLLRRFGPASWNAALAIPHPLWLRLPFAIFGLWLGGALWWVARRLFDDAGGYVALALYCTSPAMIKISSNIGPEIILAWSLLGLIYTAIGVSHTLYAPPRKWAPRIVILGLSIGFAMATYWPSFALVVLALGYMLYLAPGCRKKVLIVLSSATALGGLIWAIIYWLTGSSGLSSSFLNKPKDWHDLAGIFWENLPLYFLVILIIAAFAHFPRGKKREPILVTLTACVALPAFFALITWLGGGSVSAMVRSAQEPMANALRNLAFPLSAQTDGYVLVVLFIAALTTYGSWPRARYFGNTAPLVTGFITVLVFATFPSIRLWDATLGLTFVFIFIGGLFADLLETKAQRVITVILVAGFAIRSVLTLLALRGWVQNLM